MTTQDTTRSDHRDRRVARAALVAACLALLAGSGHAAPDGKAVFLEQKCNTCHAVPAADIEATIKIEKMKGPALPTAAWAADLERLTRIIRQEEPIEGKKHPKNFSGSDEELAALLDWLGQLAAEPAGGDGGA